MRETKYKQEHPEHVLASFKKPQGGLGEVIAQHMNEEYAELNEWAVQTLGILPTDNILEIGYGTGMALQVMSNLATQGHIVGIDLSELMFEHASRKNAAAIASGQMQLLQGQIEELPDLGIQFDKVIAVNNMTYWENAYTALKNIAVHLKPDGVLSIVYLRSPEHLYSPKGQEELKWYTDVLQYAGFSVEIETQGLKRLYRNLEAVNQKKITYTHRFHILGIKITARKRFDLTSAVVETPNQEVSRPRTNLSKIEQLIQAIQTTVQSISLKNHNLK